MLKNCVLVLLAWNGAGCGLSYTFPVFGQYLPDFECGNFAENATFEQYTNSCPNGPIENYNCSFNKMEYQPRNDYETIATEFKLVCDRDWINPLITALTFVAQGLAAATTGWLARYLSLRNGIILFRVIGGVSYLLMGFSSNLISIFVLRMVAMAAETTGYCIFGFVFAVEIVGPKYTKLVPLSGEVSC